MKRARDLYDARFRTWIEIDVKKLRANVSEFLTLVSASTRVCAIVKSNAYGHGIVGIARELSKMREFKKRGWFAVDSIVEAVRLRKEGIRTPILVLGYILPRFISDAVNHNISITVSSLETLRHLTAISKSPRIHLKIDTGMHRQGFFPEEISSILPQLKKIIIEGVYTHFADPERVALTRKQYEKFFFVKNVIAPIYPNAIFHAAASGAAILCPKTRCDMVRIGIGLYGYFPSHKARVRARGISLHPILSWKSIVSEIKRIPKGESVGYYFTECMRRDSMLAIIPIGYWHGFDRSLSSRGFVLIRGKRAKVIGRVSMDMITVDCTDIQNVAIGDQVTIIGVDGRESISAEEIADMQGTSAYEVLTRINPLIQRNYI
ncbi:MAG: alanine racemase [Patescibacteria group bacterium]